MKITLTAVALICLLGLYGESAAQDHPSPAVADSAVAAPPVDSLPVPAAPQQKIVKRDFEPRQQIVVGTAIMTFLVVIITTVSNWNP